MTGRAAEPVIVSRAVFRPGGWGRLAAAAVCIAALAAFPGESRGSIAPAPPPLWTVAGPSITVQPGDYAVVPVEMGGPGPKPAACVAVAIGHPADWAAPGPSRAEAWLPTDAPEGKGPAPGPWRWTASPPLAVGDGASEPAIHFFTLHVPHGTAAGTYRLPLALYPSPPRSRAAADREPGFCPPPAPGAPAVAHGFVDVRVPPLLRIASDLLPPRDGYPGETVTLPLRLENRGNVAASVGIVVHGPPSWPRPAAPPPPDGWNPVPQRRMVVMPGADATIPVAVAVPPGAPPGLHPVTVRLTAEAAEPMEGVEVTGSTDGGGAMSMPRRRDTRSETVRTGVRVLPPRPEQVPKLRGVFPATAHVAIRHRTAPGGAPQDTATRYRVRADLTPRRADGPRAADGPHDSRGWVDVSWGGEGSRGPVLEDLVYRHPAGWHLQTTAPRRSLSEPLLSLHAPGLLWEGDGWAVHAALPPDVAGDPGPRPPTPPAALARRLGNASPSSVAVAYRFGAPGWPPAAGLSWLAPAFGSGMVRLETAVAGDRTALGGELWWRSPSERDQPIRVTPLWEAVARWRRVPAGFEEAVGREGGELVLTRWGGGSRFQVSWRYAQEGLPPLPGLGAVPGGGPAPLRVTSYQGRWETPIGTVLGQPVSVELYGGMATLEGGPPAVVGTAPPGEAGAGAGQRRTATEVGLSLRAGGRGQRVRWTSRRRETDGGVNWIHTLALRRTGRSGWWQGFVSRAGASLWRTGVSVGWHTPGGWRWSGHVEWPLLGEGARSDPLWILSVDSPHTRGRRWSARVSAGAGWSVDVALVQPLALPSPVPPGGEGQLEGRLVGPPGADMSGAILLLDGERVSTDSEGAFRFRPRPPGRYVLAVEQLPPSLAAAASVPPPREVVIDEGIPVHVEVALPLPGAVEGRIGGAGQSGAGPDTPFVLRLWDEEGNLVAEGWTGPGGAFRLERIPPGSYALSVTPGTPAETARARGAGWIQADGGRARYGAAPAHGDPAAWHPVVVRSGETTELRLDAPPPPPGPRVTFRGEAVLSLPPSPAAAPHASGETAERPSGSPVQ